MNSREGKSKTKNGSSATRPRTSARRERESRGAEAFTVSPFARLARSHACSAAGDALFTIALADSLFFSINPNDARWQIALYLLLTVAPFAFVAPWLGPAMDRLQGGHRYMLIGSAAVRSLLAIAVAKYIGTFVLFPLAFTMLVMGKGHHVAKSALVPGIVKTDKGLVKANSRLSMISAISAAIIGLPGVVLLRFFGASWVMGLAAIVFLVGAALGTRIPATRVASQAPDRAEKAELRGAGIILAASAMGYVRAVVGFLTMLLAFELRGGVDPGPIGTGVELGHRIREALGQGRLDLATGGAPKWHFGVVLVSLGIGGLAGAAASPRLRKHFPEERILAGVLGGVALFSVLATLAGGVFGAMITAFMVAVAGQAGKQSFDAIVQRDAPKANLGRSFSRFESRFQLAWVFGALIPVVVPLPSQIGFGLIAAASAFAAVSYWLGRNPAPSTAKPRASLKSLMKGSSSSGQDGADGAGPAKPSRWRRSQRHQPVPVSAEALELPKDPRRDVRRSIFDDPTEIDAEFAARFDLRPDEAPTQTMERPDPPVHPNPAASSEPPSPDPPNPLDTEQ